MADEGSIAECWDGLVRQGGERVALVEPDGREWTRQQVEERAETLARQFGEAGLEPRRRLVMAAPNGVGWLEAFLACLKLRVVAILADWGASEAELRRVAESQRAQAIWNGERLWFLDTKPFVGRDEEVALGKLTSGSTGLPKCLYFRDSEMLADGRHTMEGFGLRSSDLILGAIPWGHSYGLGDVVMPFFLLGCRLTWCRSPLPAALEELVARLRPTVFPTVPTLLRALAQSDCRAESFASLRVVVTAGSRLDPQIARAVHGKYGMRPRNLYGSSETGSIAADTTGEETLSGRSLGRVLSGVEVSRSASGRLRVSSPAVFTRGNWRRTAQGHGVCLLGDYGAVDEEGFVSIASRAKGFVKVGEKRVGLAEAEQRLERLEEVEAAMALPVEREGRPALAAVIQSSRGRPELARAMRESLPARFRPKVWVVVEQLPETPRGKRDGQAARRLFAGRA